MNARHAARFVSRRLRLKSAGDLALRLALLVGLLAVVAWWSDIFNRAAAIPGKTQLAAVEIRLPPGGAADLGWRDLGQVEGAHSAATRHLRFERDDDKVYLSNVSVDKRLFMVFKGDGLRAFAGTLAIRPGGKADVALAKASMTLTSAPRKNGVRLEVAVSDGRRFVAEGASATRLRWIWPDPAHAPLSCRRLGPTDILRGWVSATFGGVSLARLFGGEDTGPTTIALLGGVRTCMDGEVLQIGGLGPGGDSAPWRSYRLSAYGRTLLFGAFDPAAGARARISLRAYDPGGAAGPSLVGLPDLKWRADADGPDGALSELIAGSTPYDVEVKREDGADAVTVVLRAGTRAQLIDANACALDGARQNCPHPLDEACLAGANCAFPRNLDADPAAAGCQNVAGAAAAHGAEICWRWRRAPNPLLAADAFALTLRAKGVALMRLGLLFAALTASIFCFFPLRSRLAWLAGAAVAAALCIANPLALDAGAIARLQGGFAALLVYALLLGLAAVRDKSRFATVFMLLPWISCVLAFSNETLMLLGAEVAPATTWPALEINWIFAGLTLVLSEAGATLGALWLALSFLCALGSANLMTMALDSDNVKSLDNFLKYRAYFLDMLAPVAVCAATAPALTLGRALDRFAAVRSAGAPLRMVLALGSAGLMAATPSGGLSAAWRRLAARFQPGAPRLSLPQRGAEDAWADVRDRFAFAARLSRGLGVRLLRFLLSLSLLGLMILWLSSASQTGLEDLQPAELAKFVVVLICARALMAAYETIAEDEAQALRPLRAIALDSLILLAFVVAALACLKLGLDAEVARVNGDSPRYAGLALSAATLAAAAVAAAFRALFATGAYLVLLILFVGAMIAVPGAQSDWSPALIMVLLIFAIGVAFLASLGLRLWQSLRRRQTARADTPRLFTPAPKGEYAGLTAYALALATLAGLATTADLGWGVDLASPYRDLYRFAGHLHTLRASPWLLPAGRLDPWLAAPDARLRALESEGMSGGRLVVVERLITLEDMRLGRPTSALCAPKIEPGAAAAPQATRPCYLASESQLLLARRAIAAGPCGFGDTVAPSFGLVFVAARVLSAAARVLTRCGDSPPLASEDEAPLRPIDIPVVDSDFAGAFLIARLGVAAAIAAFAAQIAFLAAPLFACGALFRIGLEKSGPRRTTGRFLLTVVSGCVALFGIQWAMSWSNILGLGPIMGQPMTLLCNASSHHVLMALPAIVTFIVAIRYANMPTFVYQPRTPPDP